MIGNPLFHPLADTTGSGYFATFVSGAIGLAFVVGVGIFLGNLIVGAIAWTTAGSEKQSLEAARGRITNAIVGIGALFSFYAVIGVIGYFFCINLTFLTFDNLVVTTGTSGGGGRTCSAISSGRNNNGGSGNTNTNNNTDNGNNSGTGTGNPLCGGCIKGGCGVTGQKYIGEADPNPGTPGNFANPCYICKKDGWSRLGGDCTNLGAKACGTCN